MFSSKILSNMREKRLINQNCSVFENFGRVIQVIGSVIEVSLHDIPLGSFVRIFNKQNSYSIEGEVVGFKKDKALVIPFQSPIGVCAESYVQCIEREQKIRVGDFLIGKVIDSYGRSLDGSPLKYDEFNSTSWPIVREPINPMTRRRIDHTFDVGVKSINSLLTLGEGQRMGIMSGSGVGKSVLMGMISRYSEADVNVIALIGERGREVREFLEENLGEDGLKKSVVVVSTGDQSPLSRVRAAHVGTAIAEYFREEGKKVLLLMDSLSRVAMAQREIGLSVGEPPTTKGYPPSVFSLLPKLLERAGNSNSKGSLTGIYTVLVEGDDFNDPVCDSARSILDGHIHLSRFLAQRNHFPAIDILASTSRVMIDIADRKQMKAASRLRDLMAEYAKNEDIITIGSYVPGMNSKLDKAIEIMPKIEVFLRQDRFERDNIKETLEKFYSMMDEEG